MDIPKTESRLPGLRTLAKDLALKGTQSTKTTAGDTVSPTKKAAPEATFVDNGERQVYQAPTWKKTKPAPIKNETEKTVPTDTLGKTPSPLKPLSGPKTAGEQTVINENEDASSATIIRDTKHNRFRLFPAIRASLALWSAEVKEKYFTKKAPTYTVPDTTRRKGVIQKATSQTGKITTFDNSSLQERIRARRDRAVPKEPTTTWSANTESGYLLLEAPSEPISQVTLVPRKSFRTVPPAAPTIAEPAPTVIPTPAPQPIPVATVAPEPTIVRTVPAPQPEILNITTPTPFTENKVPASLIPSTPPPTPTTSTPIVTETVPLEEVAAAATQTVESTPSLESKPLNLKVWLFSRNTNTISVGIVVAVFALGIVGTTTYLSISAGVEKISLTTTPTHTPLLLTPLQLVAPTSLNRTALIELIAENQRLSGFPVLQIGLTTTPSGETLLPPATVLAALEIGVDTSFSGSISTLYFGSIATNKPFIVMKVTDSKVAQGGMLNWEDTMINEIGPLLDSESNTPLEIKPSEGFIDTIITGNDTRVLIAKSGQELVAYTITKRNLLLIARNQSTLTELLTLIP
jgi:hypothetical protein